MAAAIEATASHPRRSRAATATATRCSSRGRARRSRTATAWCTAPRARSSARPPARRSARAPPSDSRGTRPPSIAPSPSSAARRPRRRSSAATALATRCSTRGQTCARRRPPGVRRQGRGRRPGHRETVKGKGLAVQFPGNTGRIDCFLTELSRAAPPTTLLGGYRVGDEVFYTGGARRSRAATAWCTAARARSSARPPARRSRQGRRRPSSRGTRTPSSATSTSSAARRPRRRSSGGYRVGDEVFYTGASYTFPERRPPGVRRQGRGRRPGHRRGVKARASPCSSRGTRAPSTAPSPAQPHGAPGAPRRLPRRRRGVLHGGELHVPERQPPGVRRQGRGRRPGHPREDQGQWRRGDVPGEQGPRQLLPRRSQPHGAPDDAPNYDKRKGKSARARPSRSESRGGAKSQGQGRAATCEQSEEAGTEEIVRLADDGAIAAPTGVADDGAIPA